MKIFRGLERARNNRLNFGGVPFIHLFSSLVTEMSKRTSTDKNTDNTVDVGKVNTYRSITF